MQQTYQNKSFTGQERILELPLKKAFSIALQSIRVRFWRSMVTAAGILLGIAFLATILIRARMDAAGIAQGLLPKPDPEAMAAATSRNTWLVAMSLIVVTVGIANSMLMSVTERFKEIGTMKCLGALDAFVRRLFMLEAGFLGVIASSLGWLVGTLIMVIAGGFSKGWPVVGAVGIMGYLETFVWCVVIGTVLTLAATFFPAQKAASMPPVMALRSEI
ncbi:MAG: FtsX-like permease family protein [Armatimonadetes bacterium]|nr:FtsX-like permease family protein [Armatimonadota bacterium]